jgi:TIR domain
MEASNVAASFLSYAHEDDDLDHGEVRRLGNRIKAEYELITGQPFGLFVDRGSVQWGEAWGQRIDTALAGATFLIPVLSPRYFERAACRYELQAFLDKATDLSGRRSILPILYAAIPSFDKHHHDPLVARVAALQYEPWVKRRLEDISSPAYRRAINRLALRLREPAIGRPAGRSPESQAMHVLLEPLEQVNERLPELIETAVSLRVIGGQITATREVFGEKHRRSRGAHAGGQLRAYLHEASELSVLEERRLAQAEILLKTTEAITPSLAIIIHIVEQHPRYRSEIRSLATCVHEVLIYIAPRVPATGPLVRLTGPVGRALPNARDLADWTETVVQDATETILKWNHRLDQLASLADPADS